MHTKFGEWWKWYLAILIAVGLIGILIFCGEIPSEYKGIPLSYTNVNFPSDILDKFTTFFKTKECQTIEYDSEEFLYKIFIGFPMYLQIEDGMIYEIGTDAEEFVNGLIKDIKENIEDFSHFCFGTTAEGKAKNIIEKSIKEVREAITEWKKS